MTTEAATSGPSCATPTPTRAGPRAWPAGWASAASGSARPGPGQVSTDGTRDVSEDTDPDDDALPEQSAGGPEDNPDGLEPKAGYPDQDPRSD